MRAIHWSRAGVAAAGEVFDAEEQRFGDDGGFFQIGAASYLDR
jgi:hypothetical protein